MYKPEVVPFFRTRQRNFEKSAGLRGFKPYIIDAVFSFAFAAAPIFTRFTPFGFSYFAAAFTNGSWLFNLASVALGGLLTSGAGSIKYLAAIAFYTALAAVGAYKKTVHKAVAAGGLLLLTNLTVCAFSGFLLYDIAIGVVESFLCFVGVFVASRAAPLIKTYSARKVISSEEFISVTAFFAVMILCLSRIPTIGKISVSNSLSLTLILMLCMKGEIGMGAVIGVVVGFVNGISNYNLSAGIGAYAFSALAAGMFKPFGKVGVCLGFMLANTVITIFLNSSTEVLISIYDIITASFVFLAMPEKVMSYFSSVGAKTAENEPDIIRRGDEIKAVMQKRMKCAAASLKKLSAMYPALDDNTPDQRDVLIMFDNCAKKVTPIADTKTCVGAKITVNHMRVCLKCWKLRRKSARFRRRICRLIFVKSAPELRNLQNLLIICMRYIK